MEKGKNTSSIPADDNQKIEQEKTIYTWKSLERPYVKKDRSFDYSHCYPCLSVLILF